MVRSSKGKKSPKKVANHKLTISLPNGSIESQLKFIAGQFLKNSSSHPELIKDFIAKHQAVSDLTDREKLIISVLDGQKLSTLEWNQVLTAITLKPKLHKDSLVFIVQRALSQGQSGAVLHYAVSGKKDDRGIVQSVGPTPSLSDGAIVSLKELKNVNFVNWKVYASQIKWTATLVLNDKSRDLVQSLIAILQTLEKSNPHKVTTKASIKMAAKQCLEVLLGKRFRAATLAEFDSKNFKKEDAVSLIRWLGQFGIECEIQVDLIRAFADAGFSEVIADRRVWSKIDLKSIAAICSHKVILEVLIKNLDLIEDQMSSSIRTRENGVGLIIQLCDQYPNFVKLVDSKFFNSFDASSKPSSTVFNIVSTKLIQSSVDRELAIQEDLKKIHATELESLKKIIVVKNLEVVSLNSKVVDLEKQALQILTDKSLAKETVLRQAQINSLITASEIIDEIRILSEEIGDIDATAVGNLYRAALRKIRKFDVQVISATDVTRADDRNLFETVEGGELSIIFVNRPAYVLTIGNSEHVLVRGKRLA